jgi:hypothetical protein
MKGAAIALRELLRRSAPDDEARDLVVFIALSLKAVGEGIEQSVAAWEKRDYWVKADRFRLEWEWAGRMSGDLLKALLADDWGAIAAECAKLGGKVQGIKLPKNPRAGTPWLGLWARLKKGALN